MDDYDKNKKRAVLKPLLDSETKMNIKKQFFMLVMLGIRTKQYTKQNWRN
jgi:hypothetical protein